MEPVLYRVGKRGCEEMFMIGHRKTANSSPRARSECGECGGEKSNRSEVVDRGTPQVAKATNEAMETFETFQQIDRTNRSNRKKGEREAVQRIQGKKKGRGRTQ